MNRSAPLHIAPLVALALLTTACGAARRAPLEASMRPMALADAPPAPLQKNHFQQDRIGTVTEQAMREILASPVFLEEGARLGIVPVATRYELDQDVPLARVTGRLNDELTSTGLFEVVSEVTTDWPGTRSIAGLRELATRYRSEYLLLYRHRFVDRSRVNGWGWAYMTIIGGLFVPSQTLESAGVLEATLFDVKTGTLLFTVFERVHAEADHTVWHNDVKVRRMQEKLLDDATRSLADQVVGQMRRLAAARPEKKDEAVVVAPTREGPALAEAAPAQRVAP